MHKYYQLLSIEFCHRYTSIEFYHRYTSGALISNLGENVVAYLRGHLTEWAERGRDAYLISPKSWPDMIIFLMHHLRVNNDISCLLTQKADPTV